MEHAIVWECCLDLYLGPVQIVAVLLGWAVLTHAFAAEVDGSELSVVEKVATCGIADDAEDDDYQKGQPREEDGEVCLPVGIC